MSASVPVSNPPATQAKEAPRQSESRGLVLCCRFAEVAFCVIAFATMASSNMFQGSSSYSYGLAAPIIGFVYSLLLLVCLLLSTRNDKMSDLMSRASCQRTVLFCDFIALILLFTAGASAATTTTAGCSVVESFNAAAQEAQNYLDQAKKQLGDYSQYLPTSTSNGYSSSGSFNCGLMRASAAFTFLAGFAYSADFWLALLPVMLAATAVSHSSHV